MDERCARLECGMRRFHLFGNGDRYGGIVFFARERSRNGYSDDARLCMPSLHFKTLLSWGCAFLSVSRYRAHASLAFALRLRMASYGLQRMTRSVATGFTESFNKKFRG